MYFEIEQVRDKLLKDVLSEEDIDESTEYINNIANRLKVDHTQIPSPAPYPVRTLAMYYALMICAQNETVLNSGGDEAGDDSYELKRKTYAKQVADLEGEITAETLLGGSTVGDKIPLSIRMGRR